jgi:ABC-2 type transport system ATP-binding protein
MPDMILSLRDISKSFGEKQVLKGISLSARGGRALGLLGRNGAGKTTAIRLIMDIFPPDSGKVLLDGMPPAQSGVTIGYLPEERGLYLKKQVLEQLVYFAGLKGMPRRAAREAAMALLERVGLSEYAGSKLETLSKGNQNKVQLVATLVGDPQILILDEPFSGLDPVNAALLKELVRECVSRGKIVFFSSHQMNYIEEFCDEIAILNGGKIVLSGGIREIKHHYDRSRLVIEGADQERLASFAREQDGLVKDLQRKGSGALLKLAAPERKNELISALLAQGVEFEGVRVFEPSLSDIFVEYTEGGI